MVARQISVENCSLCLFRRYTRSLKNCLHSSWEVLAILAAPSSMLTKVSAFKEGSVSVVFSDSIPNEGVGVEFRGLVLVKRWSVRMVNSHLSSIGVQYFVFSFGCVWLLPSSDCRLFNMFCQHRGSGDVRIQFNELGGLVCRCLSS